MAGSSDTFARRVGRHERLPDPADPAAGRASARFIPREALGRVSAWQPASLDAGVPPAPPRPGPPPPAAAREPAEADHRLALEAARREAFEAGRAEGLAAGAEAARQALRQQVDEERARMLDEIGAPMAQALAAWREQVGALEQALAHRVAGVALQVARQVVGTGLAMEPGAVVEVVRQALEALLVSARHVTVRLHPEDLARVAASDVLAARPARLVADASVGRGGCVVDSDIVRVDAQVETRWARVVGGLGLDGVAPPPPETVR